MRRKGWPMDVVAVPAGTVAVILGLSLGPTHDLAAQEQQEDVYLMDLGIIIEPDADDDSTSLTDSPLILEEVGLMVGKEPPGAAFIESTRELRAVLDDLSGRINDLESSLDEDVEAVRLENERLRALIRKIQADRKEAEVTQAVAETQAEESPAPEAAEHARLPENPGYHHVLQAYRAGLFGDVVRLYQAIDESALSPEEGVQAAYWCADACFRRGAFDEAHGMLEKVLSSEHELRDDAMILQGLIYLRQGRPAEALARFEAIVSQYPASEYHRLAELTIKELNAL